jgi:hypothetical protein
MAYIASCRFALGAANNRTPPSRGLIHREIQLFGAAGRVLAAHAQRSDASLNRNRAGPDRTSVERARGLVFTKASSPEQVVIEPMVQIEMTEPSTTSSSSSER